jgi:hypothetical protein
VIGVPAWHITSALIAATALLLTTAWFARPPDAARTALDRHCADIDPAAAYPQAGTTLRARAWLASTPERPAGIDLFCDLPDAVCDRERLVTPSDLRETLRRIRGLTWHAQAGAWIGGERRVPLAEVQSLLVAALPTPTVADAVIDLLRGSPAPGAPDFTTLLLADQPTLNAIRIIAFHGDRGRLLLDNGHPPYEPVERGYTGLLAAFDGVGWPDGWRVLRLRGVEP